MAIKTKKLRISDDGHILINKKDMQQETIEAIKHYEKILTKKEDTIKSLQGEVCTLKNKPSLIKKINSFFTKGYR